MRNNPVLRAIALLIVAGCSLVGVRTQAGTATYDFSTDPRTDPQFIISSNVDDSNRGLDFYEAANGNPGGYIAVTRSVNSQSSQVLFPDFDHGLIVKALTFECDLRLGNPTGNGGAAADGFSISYARAGDPAVQNLIDNPTSTDTSQYAVNGGPENGTKTGIAISFDTWSGNTLPDGADWPGLANALPGGVIVRVDNVTVLRYRMATGNGACADLTSLQTGPYDAAADAAGEGGAYTNLCWQKLKVDLAESGELTVTYKGSNILDKFPTGYSPSAGRILMAGRTGGANENNHIDNLTITTIPADKILIGTVAGNAFGFQFTVSDSGASVLDPASLALKYNGNVVTASAVNKPAGGNVTTVDYTDLSTRLAPGTTNTLQVTAKDTQNNTVTRTQTYVIPNYALVPASYKVAGTPTTPGLKARTYWIDETVVNGFTTRYPGNQNTIPDAEQELAIGYADPATGQPYPNSASPENNDITVVNWDQSGGDIDATNPDNFNSVEPASGPVPNDAIPGIAAGDPNNVVVETVAYVQLKKGINRMGVNSDDGFKLSAAPGQPSVAGITLGSFNDGRGASDSIFEFAVEEDGYYPLRLLWWEGGGGANCEWFSVDRVTGEKILVNGTPAASVKAFRTGAGRAVIKSILPSDGYAAAKAPIKAELVDGSTTVVDGSVKLIVDGTDVTAQSQIVNGATTTVTYNPAGGFKPDSAHTWQLIWTESTSPTPTTWTNNFSFSTARLAPDDLPAQGAFWIEAEDWDYNKGQSKPEASVMPYTGGAYDGLAGVLNVDYFDDNNNPDTDTGIDYTYRTDQRPNHVNVTVTTANRFAVDRPGSVDLTIDYRIGWAGNFWGNYTRAIPPGVYKAYAALSIDNSNANGTYADLDRVTAGVGTTSQTLERIGTFFGRGNGAWGSNELAPLKDSAGNDTFLNIEGATTTLRVTARSGDFDWFVLIPATSPAKLRSGPPQGTGAFSIPHTLTWVFDDFSTTIDVASAALKIDGAAVSAPAFTIAKTGKVTTAKYVADIGKVHSYEFTIKDNAGATLSSAGTFIGNHMTPSPAGMFLIETEDFNTGGGQVKAAANTMPYLGNAYTGLSAVPDIDYARSGNEPSGDVYRLTENPNVPFSVDPDMVRARDANGTSTWTVTANYRQGWAGGGNWYNYTRQIPAGNYQVWASMSFGDPGADVINGILSRVTSDPTQAGQTIETIGYFSGPSTGGWGANQLFPLRTSDADSTGDAAVVALGGATPTTLRFEDASGDLDYFILVPAEALPPGLKFNPPTISNGTVTLSWTGPATLQQASALTGSATDWTDVTPQPTGTSTTVSAGTAGNKFYRLKQ